MEKETSFTDNEIIKALEHCLNREQQARCANCEHVTGCKPELMRKAFDLINRQKAEIESLNIQLHNAKVHLKETKKSLQDEKLLRYNEKFIESEARKELAEELRSKARKYTEYDEGGWDRDVYAVEVAEIDNLLEEMEKKT